MAKYRKLGRTASQRKALIRAEVTNLLHHGKIVTTEAKAKEIRKVAEKLIALAVKEKDNFETVTVDLTCHCIGSVVLLAAYLPLLL